MERRFLEMAAQEHVRRKRQTRNLVVLALAVALALGGIVYAVKEFARSQQPVNKVVIDPSQLPPIRPGSS
jgi:hypothetical protein